MQRSCRYCSASHRDASPDAGYRGPAGSRYLASHCLVSTAGVVVFSVGVMRAPRRRAGQPTHALCSTSISYPYAEGASTGTSPLVRFAKRTRPPRSPSRVVGCCGEVWRGSGEVSKRRNGRVACQGETKRVAFRQMSECGSLLKPTHVTDACTSALDTCGCPCVFSYTWNIHMRHGTPALGLGPLI